jgi:hypothetical protein
MKSRKQHIRKGLPTLPILRAYAISADKIRIFENSVFAVVSQDSAVGIAASYWLDDRGVGVTSRWGQEFSPLHVFQTGSGVHPTFYPMCTGGCFPGSKAAGS